MATNEDFRLKTDFHAHPKVVKLRRKLKADGVLGWIQLLGFAAVNRPNGIFDGMDHEDIAIAAGYDGEGDEFAEALVAVRLLDRTEGGVLSLHDWADHNPYAAKLEERSEVGRFLANKRWAKERERLGIDADGNAVRTENDADGNAVRTENDAVGNAPFRSVPTVTDPTDPDQTDPSNPDLADPQGARRSEAKPGDRSRSDAREPSADATSKRDTATVAAGAPLAAPLNGKGTVSDRLGNGNGNGTGETDRDAAIRQLARALVEKPVAEAATALARCLCDDKAAESKTYYELCVQEAMNQNATLDLARITRDCFENADKPAALFITRMENLFGRGWAKSHSGRRR